MSIDTTDERDADPPAALPTAMSDGRWQSLCEELEAGSQPSVAATFGEAARRGGVYRWGVALSLGSACDETTDFLSRLACRARIGKDRAKTMDVTEQAHSFAETVAGENLIKPIDAAAAVLWAAALPALTAELEQAEWWRLVESLRQLHDAALQHGDTSSPTYLMLGAELGLTLAWRLECIADCARLRPASIEALNKWCQCDGESVSAAIAQGADVRLVLASWIRCKRITDKTCKKAQRLSKRQRSTGRDLATWVAAMTTCNGTGALSRATRKEIRDDLPPDGLLGHAAKIDSDALKPALAAALGETQTGGRLVWEIGLPDTMHHDADAKIAVLFPDWDVRRGRTHVDYSGDEPRIEIFAGRAEVISGDWQTRIEIDDQEQQACSEWCDVCEYSDDDVHYLEIEQDWTGGVVLQRQIMLVRDDRCLLLADSVLPCGEEEPEHSLGSIQYFSRLPLCPQVTIDRETETREMFLVNGRRRGLVIPLSAAEWRVERSTSTLKETEDRHLLFSASGRGRLYAPLWFDFQQRRFKRKRTWRQLTVAEQLRRVSQEEAAGFRVQVGSEHWAIYRSLAGRSCRSMLGQHVIADFVCSRFDPGDGSHDELVTVDDRESDDE